MQFGINRLETWGNIFEGGGGGGAVDSNATSGSSAATSGSTAAAPAPVGASSSSSSSGEPSIESLQQEIEQLKRRIVEERQKLCDKTTAQVRHCPPPRPMSASLAGVLVGGGVDIWGCSKVFISLICHLRSVSTPGQGLE